LDLVLADARQEGLVPVGMATYCFPRYALLARWAAHIDGYRLMPLYQHAVNLSGCSQIGLSADEIEQELVRLTNRAMRRLYELGCRRMRTIKLPRTGDPIRYVVQGSRGWRW
jgi:hypothetical protein